MTKIITVSRDGSMRFIYDDDLRRLLDHGQAAVRRASHIEPGDPAKGQEPLLWYADLTPSGGDLYGPFASRRAALAAEVEWLNGHLLTCTRTIDVSGSRP